jgi:hypothetical protein
LRILLGRTLHSVSALLPPPDRPFRPSLISFFPFGWFLLCYHLNLNICLPVQFCCVFPPCLMKRQCSCRLLQKKIFKVFKLFFLARQDLILSRSQPK